MKVIAIDMETATLFVVGHKNQIARGALLLVSDLPLTPEGIKTEHRDQLVTQKWASVHLQIGIDALSEIGRKGETIKHFRY
jgi:AMP nucleosidase